MIKPSLLKPNDCIAILSPSGKVESEYVSALVQGVEQWGFSPRVMPHCLSVHGRFAGMQPERMGDLIAAIEDPDVKAIWCSRGGYGVMQLLGERLHILRDHPKWIIGYSDITALHRLAQSCGIESIHAPMAKHFSEEGAEDFAMQSLFRVLTQGTIEYSRSGHRLNRFGKTTGMLEGGNLAVLSGLRGTPYDLSREGAILFVEDIGERPYQIERMMLNLRLSGRLQSLKGLIVGQFTGYDEDGSMGKGLYEVIEACVSDYDYPVVYDFPVGHVSDNLPLICGRMSTLEVSESGWKLSM